MCGCLNRNGKEGSRTPDGSNVTVLQTAPTRIADSRHFPLVSRLRFRV